MQQQLLIVFAGGVLVGVLLVSPLLLPLLLLAVAFIYFNHRRIIHAHSTHFFSSPHRCDGSVSRHPVPGAAGQRPENAPPSRALPAPASVGQWRPMTAADIGSATRRRRSQTP